MKIKYSKLIEKSKNIDKHINLFEKEADRCVLQIFIYNISCFQILQFMQYGR